MLNIADTLGLESFCLRNFPDNAKAAQMVKECGLSAIELCFAHIDYADTGSHEDIIRIYKSANVDITSLFAGLDDNEAAQEQVFEFARMSGARYMSVDFPVGSVPQSFRIAERLAEKYAVRLGIHNHGGSHWLGSIQMLEHIFSQTNDRIGLCLDTGWAIDAHENPLEMIRRFSDRLYVLHLRDLVFDRAREPEDVVFGTGNINLGELKSVLEETGFTGLSILETSGEPENPVPAMSQSVANIRDYL